MRLTRYFMYKRIGQVFLKPIAGKILGISEIDNFNFLIDKNKSEIIITHHPKVDIQNLPFEENSFDFVISDQVLEHVENPLKAVAESHRVLKQGGIAIHTTCFINYFHPSPKDYWRFSPDALRFLCKNFSEIMQCEGWGNMIATLISLLGDRFRGISIPEKRSLRRRLATSNNERYPIVTWIVARK